jgi:hypothetical protein
MMNVLNLVKEDIVFYENQKYTKETVDKKVAWITEQLKRMNATIVGFEVRILSTTTTIEHFDPISKKHTS